MSRASAPRAVITHRNTLLTVARAAQAAHGHRPARPPWAFVRGRGVVAPCCNEACEVVILFSPAAAAAEGGPTLLERGVRISAGAVVCALDARDLLALAGRVDGAVAVINPGTRADGSQPALLAVVPPPAGPPREVAFLVALPPPALALAVDADSKLSVLRGGAKTANAAVAWTPPTPRAPTAVAVRGGGKQRWEAVVADAEGKVWAVDERGAERSVPGAEFGNVLCVAWAAPSGREVVVGGEDDCLHRVGGDHPGTRPGKEERFTFGKGDDPEQAHCSFVTSVARRGKCFASCGMDGRVVVWGEDGFGEVVLCREGESFYKLVWAADDIIFASACVDAQGKCVLYRIKVAEKYAVKERP